MESKISQTKRVSPSLELESEFFAAGKKYVAGIDEVGRGALAGPVAVGIVVIKNDQQQVPANLADSKLISKSVREALIPKLEAWVAAYAIGYASANEIDQVGLVSALRLAANRALTELTIKPEQIILDGKHNWLHTQQDQELNNYSVATKVKADQTCASVAAASVLAKVNRDEFMQMADKDFPGYGFAKNVGYGSAQHMSAIRKFGPSELHRTSWNLPKSD